jgi:GNAT superfamily N-acetyltransferase
MHSPEKSSQITEEPNRLFNAAKHKLSARRIVKEHDRVRLGTLDRSIVSYTVVGRNDANVERSEPANTCEDAQIPAEYSEILSLRLRAHQREGHLKDYSPADLASSFDSHSRHLVCRSGGRIIGYVRLINVDRDPTRSQYVSLGGHEVPAWLWRAGFIEAGAGALEPDRQRSGLFHVLMQHAVQVARAAGHRFMLGASPDHLLRMYQNMGFSILESRLVEPIPGWAFRSNLFVMDMERLHPPLG